MRLSKFSKRMIAFISAIALVVAGLTFAPATATKADAPDWSTISYLADGAGGGAYNNKYKFYAESGTLADNIQNPPWGTAAGIYVPFPAADIKCSLESVDIQGAGALLHLSNFTNKVTEFTVSWAGGSTTCYVYYEDGSEDPTQAPSVDPSTEAPSVDPSTEAPTEEWLSARNRWVHRNADGTWKVEDGPDYNAVQGLTALYSGANTTADVDVKNVVTEDLFTISIKVNAVATEGEWAIQLHANKEGLDTSKVYKATLKAGDTVLNEDIVSNDDKYRKTIDLTQKIKTTGEMTLILTITEETKPEPPVPQDITITPNETEIAKNYNIWASWKNPEGTAKALVYLEQADNAHAAATLNNGWIFNDNAVQPMVGVDRVAQTRDASIKVQPGGTYKLVVEAFDAWDRSTGTGSVEIKIPEAPIGGEITFTRAERVDTEIGGKTYYAAFANWESVPGAAGYKSYYDVEDDDHKVKASTVDWVWSDQNPPIGSSDTWIDNSARMKNNTSLDENKAYTLIVVAYNASNEEVARGTAELPAKTTPSSESPSVDPSTEAPTSSGEIVMDTQLTTPGWQDFGGYSVFLGSWDNVTALAGIDQNNSDHVKIQIKSTSDYSPDGLQIKKNITGLNPSESYNVEWSLKSDNNDGKLKVYFDGGKMVSLTGQAQTITASVQADASGNLEIAIGAGQVGLDNAIEYQQPIIKDKDGKVVYPPTEPTSETPTQETSTEAPTETSTEAPTETTTEAPTQEPTTQAPTQKPTEAPTTVAPTKLPDPVPVIKIPDKAKVKKAVKKKKSAKKIKVKLAKVKGAKGYQVQVSKKKKGKALVKKYTTKTKLTIKSKKFKKKKKLYVKVRAYTLDGTVKIFGAWSKPKKTTKK